MSDVARICSTITFHLSKLWNIKFSILCDVIFLVRLQGKFDIDHSQEERVNPKVLPQTKKTESIPYFRLKWKIQITYQIHMTYQIHSTYPIHITYQIHSTYQIHITYQIHTTYQIHSTYQIHITYQIHTTYLYDLICSQLHILTGEMSELCTNSTVARKIVHWLCLMQQCSLYLN